MFDPLSAGIQMSATNLIVLNKGPSAITCEIMQTIKTPTIMALGEKDCVVSNNRAREIFDSISALDKNLICVKNASHFPFHDKEGFSLVSNEIIRFFSRV
jgi:esterase/lipase